MSMTGGAKGCKAGQIRRVTYKRKGYTKADGTRVKATVVRAKCIKDRGGPGKGPYTLPKLKDNGFLTSEGYHLKLSVKDRQAALRKACRKYGCLKVIRHLGLVRNYSKSVKTNFAKYTKDLEYVSELYKKQKAAAAARK
jgi:hypothetical protein